MPGLFRNDHALLREGHAVQRIQALHKRGAFIRLAIPIRILQHDDFVLLRLPGHRVRETRHRHHPKPATGIEGDLHGRAQFRKLFIGAKEIHRISLRHLEFRLRLGGIFHHPHIAI